MGNPPDSHPGTAEKSPADAAIADIPSVCGILGFLAPLPHRPAISADAVIALRDLLVHRGPDGAGLWEAPGLTFAHRRLAVVDPTENAAQPMIDPAGRGALVYNGEIYNDADLRSQLAARGVCFRTNSDTETLLHALIHWGEDALPRIRGMYAFVFADLARGRAIMARDPLGIKPLYYTRRRVSEGTAPAHEELVFASEAALLTRVPGVPHEPDLVTLSAYLTTIRTTLGERTLFRGVRTLLPGQCLIVDQHDAHLAARNTPHARLESSRVATPAAERDAIEESIRLHLRSDVPICSLLSGGLDSSIIAAVARPLVTSLHTYCSGAPNTAPGGSEDFAFAREVAAHIGSIHTEAPVSRELFHEQWAAMVHRMGVPLSTPNEVAIHEVARTLRSQGYVVALSGEGADELFAGYDAPMAHAAAYIAGGGRDHGMHQLLDAAWIAPDAKPAILNGAVWSACEQDHALIEQYRSIFEEVAPESTSDPNALLGAHLRFIRRVNLAGLLGRLDTATMLASVEGRTPFADVGVARLAESLPMSRKYTPGQGHAPAATKITLRHAFESLLPASVVQRPKASFPLPFQEWVGDTTPSLTQSRYAREIFTEAALTTVAANPAQLWQLAWPMANICLWLRRFE